VRLGVVGVEGDGLAREGLRGGEVGVGLAERVGGVDQEAGVVGPRAGGPLPERGGGFLAAGGLLAAGEEGGDHDAGRDQRLTRGDELVGFDSLGLELARDGELD